MRRDKYRISDDLDRSITFFNIARTVLIVAVIIEIVLVYSYFKFVYGDTIFNNIVSIVVLVVLSGIILYQINNIKKTIKLKKKYKREYMIASETKAETISRERREKLTRVLKKVETEEV